MGGAAALVWLFTANVTTTVVLALAGIFGSVMMTTKDQSNLSVVDQVQNLVRFLRRQKIYPYRYGDEWGLNNVRSHSRFNQAVLDRAEQADFPDARTPRDENHVDPTPRYVAEIDPCAVNGIFMKLMELEEE